MIKEILILQRREIERKLKEPYVERMSPALKINSPLIKVIMGPRRAGKSFFALHYLGGGLGKGGNFGYANFDDEKLAELENYNELIAELDVLYNNPKILFFDEIQNISKWELFVNRLQRQGRNIMITGSNSNLLSQELATHLTGRHTPINILTFSFKEFLRHNKKELTSSEIKSKLDQYIVFGGYPEPLVKNLDYKEYISNLFDSVIYKDIIKRHNIRSSKRMEDLAFYLLANVSSEYSYNSLTKTANLASSHTTEKYLSYLEESFIFFSLKRFSYKAKEQVSSNKKIYCFDNGMIYAKAFKINSDFGRIYENVVAQELKRKEMDKLCEIYYWKNQQQEEVDFVVRENLKIKQLIQVCFNVEKPKTKDREIRALLKAGKELKCKELLVITENYEHEENVKWFDLEGKIKFIPLWKWLLKN
ncbi:MAG: ATP-binding protein [Nanoarchaeota archaeon]|mgnify:CR=1 FL=1